MAIQFFVEMSDVKCHKGRSENSRLRVAKVTLADTSTGKRKRLEKEILYFKTKIKTFIWTNETNCCSPPS
jgi:hypothetical protein